MQPNLFPKLGCSQIEEDVKRRFAQMQFTPDMQQLKKKSENYRWEAQKDVLT